MCLAKCLLLSLGSVAVFAHMHEIKVCSRPSSAAPAVMRKTPVSVCGGITGVVYRSDSLESILTSSPSEPQSSDEADPDVTDSNLFKYALRIKLSCFVYAKM